MGTASMIDPPGRLDTPIRAWGVDWDGDGRSICLGGVLRSASRVDEKISDGFGMRGYGGRLRVSRADELVVCEGLCWS